MEKTALPLSLRAVFVILFTITLSACATRSITPYVRPAPEYAVPAQPDSAFSDIETAIYTAHGPEASGFELLDSNEDGLRWRLALIDSARHSIDVQYYLWHGDTAGRLLVKRLLNAANRGVKVRILVDDLNTLLGDSGTLSQLDHVAAWLDAHPNLELRLFNPWKKREIMERAVEAMREFKRVNQRMHNKAMIVDNQAVILGGRNIGDEYMGLNEAFNFHDLDVLGIGPVARQASDIFDAFWNSAWVMPAAALQIPITKAELAQRDELLLQRLNEKAESLANFPLPPQTWSAELGGLQGRLHIGTSRVLSDQPTSEAVEQVMFGHIQTMLESAQREILIINAYIIPTDRGIAILRELQSRGAQVKILTNSLASHDVPAVNSHYKKWRKPILEAGAELYEMRHNAEIQSLVSDTPPTRAKFMGLHSKAMVADRKHVYIGSMNYDPRSALINTEMGVFIESDGLSEELVQLIDRDIQPANSWRVQLNGDGELRWINDSEVVSTQPARNWWQRVEDVIFRAFPKELY